MKSSVKFLTIAATLLLFTTSSYAQESATATATATILTPIAITKTVDMNFGNVAVQSTTGGTVILAPAGTRTVTGGVTLPATAGTVTAATFTVTGTTDYTYTVSLPVAAVTLTETVGATATMTATAFTSTPTTTAGAGVLTLGTQTLKVGATLNVAAGQATGVYVSPAFTVTVNYN